MHGLKAISTIVCNYNLQCHSSIAHTLHFEDSYDKQSRKIVEMKLRFGVKNFRR